MGSSYAGVVPGVGDSHEGARTLLSALIDCVRDNRSISDLIAPNVEGEAIRAQIRQVCRGPVEIEAIAGNDVRIDAVVTSDHDIARIVFARNEQGLLTRLHTHVKPPRFSGVAGGRVIVVNGPSGVGKSTLMSALQSIAALPLVVLDEPEQIGTAQQGYLIWRDTAPALHRRYLAAICALAGADNLVALSAADDGPTEVGLRLFSPFDGGLERCQAELLRHRCPCIGAGPDDAVARRVRHPRVLGVVGPAFLMGIEPPRPLHELPAQRVREMR